MKKFNHLSYNNVINLLKDDTVLELSNSEMSEIIKHQMINYKCELILDKCAEIMHAIWASRGTLEVLEEIDNMSARHLTTYIVKLLYYYNYVKK